MFHRRNFLAYPDRVNGALVAGKRKPRLSAGFWSSIKPDTLFGIAPVFHRFNCGLRFFFREPLAPSQGADLLSPAACLPCGTSCESFTHASEVAPVAGSSGVQWSVPTDPGDGDPQRIPSHAPHPRILGQSGGKHPSAKKLNACDGSASMQNSYAVKEEKGPAGRFTRRENCRGPIFPRFAKSPKASAPPPPPDK